MHVVLLGPRPEAIEELHGLGHTLTVLYTGSGRRPVQRYGDRVAHWGSIPAYDACELAWSVLLHLGVADEVDAVIACHELGVVTAAFLHHVLRRPARIGLPAAMAGRDKARQKSLWAGCGIPTARFATLTNAPRSLGELRAELAGLSAPFVVKPPSLGGSRLVRACPSVADVFDAVRDNPELRHAVVEERQPGDEWHFDGVVVDGRVEHIMVSRYLAPLIETKHGLTLRSVAFPVARHRALYTEARQFALAAVEALDGRWGVFHLEVFGQPGAFIAGELAWRPAGVLAPLSAEYTIGVNLWAAHVRVLVGAELPDPLPIGEGVAGFVCLPLKPGARNGLTEADIAALPGVRHVEMRLEPGELMGAMHASTLGVAMVLIEGSDIEDCERLIDQAVELTMDLHDRKSSPDGPRPELSN